MGSLNLSSAEIAALQNSPALLVGAINDTISQLAFLSDHFASISGTRLDIAIPAYARLPTSGAELSYGPDGLTAPRADGAVRSRAWDAAVTAASDSADPVLRAWAQSRVPWIFVQDTLTHPALTQTQRDAVVLNCARCRFMNGLMSTPNRKLAAWVASPVESAPNGARLVDAVIADAFATSSDMESGGAVTWVGLRSSDLQKFAENSLAHFIRTSGPAVLRALGQ